MKTTSTGYNDSIDVPGPDEKGYSRIANPYAGNQSGQKPKENYGRGPTVGNHDTRTAGPTGNGVKVHYNSDSINMGRGPTNPGSTRPFAPNAKQNYRGNPDMMNVGRGPTKGNMC